MKDKLKRILSTHIDVDTLIVNNKEYYWIKQNIDWESINGDIFSEAKNTISDGYSIPKKLWPAIRGIRAGNRIEKETNLVPSFLHDDHYRLQRIPKRMADMNLRIGIIGLAPSILEISTTKKLRKRWGLKRKRMQMIYTAWKVWFGLLLGGWVAWNNYKHDLETYGYEYVKRMSTANTREEVVSMVKNKLIK